MDHSLNYIKIGEFGKPHGLKGELKLWVDDLYFDDLLEAKVVFTGPPSSPFPYFVEHIRGGQFVLIKLEGIDRKEDALFLRAKPLLLKESDVTVSEEEISEIEHPYFRLAGYELFDLEKGRIGKIEEVVEMPFQFMARLMIDEKEVLIPLHEQLIQEQNEPENRIVMDLPEG